MENNHIYYDDNSERKGSWNFLSLLQKCIALQITAALKETKSLWCNSVFDQTEINDLLNDVCRNSRNRKKCIICCKYFYNSFIRDLHLKYCHDINLSYFCERCEDLEEEDDCKFECLYLYHVHRIEVHHEASYQFNHILVLDI